MATITSAATGDWLTGATWVGGVAPTTGDNAVIALGHTVTVNGNVTIGNDTATAAITINGTLKFSRTVSHVLTLRGTVAHGTSAVWDRGTQADPIPAGVTSGVVYNSSASPATDKYPFNFGLNNGFLSFSEWGADKTYVIKLPQPLSAGDSVLSSNDTTGWEAGDVLAVSSTNKNNLSEREHFTILGINPNVNVLFTPVSSYAHDTNGYVFNMTRNVYWEQAQANTAAYTRITIRDGMTPGCINIANVAYYGACIASQDRGGLTFDSINNSLYDDATSPFGTIKGLAFNPTTRRDNTNMTVANGQVLTLRALATLPTISDIVVYSRVGLTGHNAITTMTSGSANIVRPSLMGSNTAISSSYSAGGVGCNFTDVLFLNHGSYAIFASPAIGLKVTGGVIDAGTYVTNLNTGGVTLEGVAIGQGAGMNDSQMFYTVKGAGIDFKLIDCLMPSTAITINKAAITQVLPMTRLTLENKDADTTNQETWMRSGPYFRDNTVLMNSRSSVRFEPYVANLEHGETTKVSAAAGVPLIMRFSLKYDTAYGNTYPPSITVSGLGITPVTFTAGNSPDTVYSQVITVTPTATGSLSVAVTGKSTSTTGKYWVSGIPFPPYINWVYHYGYVYNPTSHALTVDPSVQLTEAQAAALPGISYDVGTNTLLVTSSTNIHDLYDWMKWYETSNQLEPVMTAGDDYNFTLNAKLTLMFANTLTGAGVINMPTNILTLGFGGSSEPTIIHRAGTLTRLEVNGMIAGSRVQLYNLTDSVELCNEDIGVETAHSIPYTWTSNKSVRVRVTNCIGTNAYLPFETLGTITQTGLVVTVNQQLDTVYNANGIDGSATTEFTPNYDSILVEVNDADGVTSVQRLYAWYCSVLMTPAGIAATQGGILAEDVINYRIMTSILNVKVKNVGMNPVVIEGARLYRDDGTSIFIAGTGPIQLESGKAYQAPGVVTLTDIEASTVLAKEATSVAIKAQTDVIPTAGDIAAAVDSSTVLAKEATSAAIKAKTDKVLTVAKFVGLK